MTESDPQSVSATHSRQLGTVDASEQLLRDLYIRLRAALRGWSEVTLQTPQARMGYIGQHLTSVVTGYPGTRSGARGKDIILPSGKHAEIKTCTRVDQLGKCNSCGAGVSSIEMLCPSCRNSDIKRNDDSKWLIGIRHEGELRQLFDPECYFLVIFEFSDIKSATDINAKIYEVNPREKGFAFCMVDYYFNIRQKSKSKAPFNLWPYSLKFYLMKPTLIYHSAISSEDDIETMIFPGRNESENVPLPRLDEFSRASNLTEDAINALAAEFEVVSQANKKATLQQLQQARQKHGWNSGDLADAIAEAIYRPRIERHKEWLPGNLQGVE